jgi:hypothetical protein
MTYYDEQEPEREEIYKDGKLVDDPVLTTEQIKESRKAKLQEEIELRERKKVCVNSHSSLKILYR